MRRPHSHDHPRIRLRTAAPHYEAILNEPHAIDWLEVITENYLVPGGQPLSYLDRIRERFPHGHAWRVAVHRQHRSIGSGISRKTSVRWPRGCSRSGFPIISVGREWKARTCTTSCRCPIRKKHSKLVAARVGEVQDRSGSQILLENVSSYLTYRDSELSEWQFLSEVAARADCALLLDINNIYVSSVNHGFDPVEYLDAIPAARVRQFHLAGHSDMNGYLIDTHDHPIVAPVWDLYGKALARFGDVPTMIERDDNIPPLSELVEELAVARAVATRHSQRAA